MICADCGVEMNHHADKVNRAEALNDPDHADTDLGGVLEETHTCSGCGETEVQKAN